MTTGKKTAASWQQQQRALRELAVLDAASELMSARGFSETSMDDIATRVGISKPTLYQHFRSKNAIAEAVMLRNQEHAEERIMLMEAQIEQGARARPQLERHIREAIGVYQGLWASRAQIPTELRDARKLRTRRERIWERYARIIDRCKAEGDCRDDIPTPLLVRSVVRVFRGDYLDLIENGTTTLEELSYSLASLLFDGMAPRATATPNRTKPGAIAQSAVALLMAGMTFALPLSAQTRATGTPAAATSISGAPLTLADVLDAALRANPTARAAVAEARVATSEFASARGSWFPTISFAPAFIVSQNTAGNSEAATLSNADRQRVTFSPSINLSYLLFDFGGRAGTVGAARHSANSVAFSRDVTVQLTVLGAEQSYFDYQAAQGVLLAQTDNVATATANRDAAVGRFQAGIATVADTLQASTALAGARVSLVSARAALVNARTELATIMGARADVPFRVAIEPAPTANDVRMVTNELGQQVDTLIAHALRRRPDVAEAAELSAAASERVHAARSALLPSLQLSAATGRTLANQNTLDGSSYSVQIGLALPLFDGGTRRANLQASRAELDATRAREDATNVAVVNSVVTSIEAFRLSAEQVTTTDELLASAIASEDVARGRYREGVGTIVDLITAQAALAAARSQFAQARWGWATSLSQLSRDAGVLGPSGELPVTAGSLPSTAPPDAPSRSRPPRLLRPLQE